MLELGLGMVNQNTTQLMPNIKREDLVLDLREINWTLENRKQIMASEYVELGLAKREIIKKLMKGEYE